MIVNAYGNGVDTMLYRPLYLRYYFDPKLLVRVCLGDTYIADYICSETRIGWFFEKIALTKAKLNEDINKVMWHRCF